MRGKPLEVAVVHESNIYNVTQMIKDDNLKFRILIMALVLVSPLAFTII